MHGINSCIHQTHSLSPPRMKAFVLVVSTLVVLGSARPEYNYNPPSGSYGVPGGGRQQALIADGNIGHFTQGGGGGGGLIADGNIGHFTGGGGNLGGGGGLLADGNIGHFTSGGGGIIGGGGGLIGGGLIGGGGGGGGGFIGGGGVSTVQKHIYVHVAPPEPEEFRPQRVIGGSQSTKHYKIIFIKAPSAPAATAPTIPLQAQNEEKTLVYVLVKKPDDAADITIPTAAPTQPSKPEVYFIRYKTKSQSTGGVTGGVTGGITGGILTGGIGISTGGIGISTGGTGTGISTGTGGIGIGTGITGAYAPSTNYGPPGKSGPY